MRTAILSCAILLLVACGSEPSSQGKPNVILISLDALRADHVTCYGYERSITPTLDSLALSGIMFNKFQAQAPRTLPSCASVFTGLSVVTHQAGSFVDGAFDEGLPSIQQTLSSNGYFTAALGNVIYFSELYHFDKYFDYIQCNMKGTYTGAQTFYDAQLCLEEQMGNRDPFFIFIHIFEIHLPYDPPKPYDRMFTDSGSEGVTDWIDGEGELVNPEDCGHLLNMYDGEIAFTDHILGEFLSWVRTAGLADNTLIIVFSDHGEEFLEHGGWAHGHSLYQELLGVPLIVSGPGITAGIIDSLSSAHFDIYPTILDYLDIPIPGNVEGVSLLSDSLRDERVIPSSGLDPQWPGFGGVNPDACYLVSVLKGNLKLIMNMRTGQSQMFNLESDPGERNPLTADSALVTDAEFYWTTVPQGNLVPIDQAQTNSVLRDLGYI